MEAAPRCDDGLRVLRQAAEQKPRPQKTKQPFASQLEEGWAAQLQPPPRPAVKEPAAPQPSVARRATGYAALRFDTPTYLFVVHGL